MKQPPLGPSLLWDERGEFYDQRWPELKQRIRSTRGGPGVMAEDTVKTLQYLGAPFGEQTWRSRTEFCKLILDAVDDEDLDLLAQVVAIMMLDSKHETGWFVWCMREKDNIDRLDVTRAAKLVNLVYDKNPFNAKILLWVLSGFATPGNPSTVTLAETLRACGKLSTPVMKLVSSASAFISHGAPDEPFARRLYEALEDEGIRCFLFAEHAVPGEKLHRTMKKGIAEHDRVILICSRASLDRKGVVIELEETLAREHREGEDYLIPIRLDDYVLKDWAPKNPDVAQAVRDRVVADFTGADQDDEKFQAGLRRLIAVLRK